MDPIATLLLAFLARDHLQPKPPSASVRAPAWPTPSSPPPMPAFQPKATPTPADAARPATPLADLHAASKAAAKPAPKPAAKPAPKPRAAPNIVPGVMTSTLPVARLQQALIARGAKLVPDGLYGPKTAAAWKSLATSKGLPSAIARKGPKLADVVTHTFDALSLPAIP